MRSLGKAMLSVATQHHHVRRALPAAGVLCALLPWMTGAAPSPLNPPLVDAIIKTAAPDPLRGRVVALSTVEGLAIEADSKEVVVPWRDLVRIETLHDAAPRNPRARLGPQPFQ